METEKLKGCPFCNAIDLRHVCICGGFWRVECRVCGASGGQSIGAENSAEYWNLRAVDLEALAKRIIYEADATDKSDTFSVIESRGMRVAAVMVEQYAKEKQG